MDIESSWSDDQYLKANRSDPLWSFLFSGQGEKFLSIFHHLGEATFFRLITSVLIFRQRLMRTIVKPVLDIGFKTSGADTDNTRA